MKKMIGWSLRILGILLMIRGVIALLGGRQEVLNKVLEFNKRVLNPVMLPLAGRKYSPYALLHHVGRRSGQAHTHQAKRKQPQRGEKEAKKKTSGYSSGIMKRNGNIPS